MVPQIERQVRALVVRTVSSQQAPLPVQALAREPVAPAQCQEVPVVPETVTHVLAGQPTSKIIAQPLVLEDYKMERLVQRPLARIHGVMQ